MTTALTARTHRAATGTTPLSRLGDLATSTAVGRIAAATLVAAVLDAGFALVAYVVIAGRYNLETLLQYIATGLLGHHAYRTGVPGIGTAALGFGTHLGLAAGFAIAFALIAAPRLKTRSQAAVAGLTLGVAIWFLMANAVLPALGVAHEPIGGRYWWPFLADHALLVGLPISLLTSGRKR